MMFETVHNRWLRLLSAALGIWLMVAPDALEYGKPASTVHHIIGPVAAAFAIFAFWGHLRPLRWVHPPLGVVLIVVPPLLGVLGNDTVPLANGVIVGLALIGLGLVRGRVAEHFGNGWSAVRNGGVLSDLPDVGVDLGGDRFRDRNGRD